MERAERSETSCSPLRPPKRTPTRSFLRAMSLPVWPRHRLCVLFTNLCVHLGTSLRRQASNRSEVNPAMNYVRLGQTGVRVSPLCLGMMTYGSKKWREWVLDEEEARPFIKRALDAGINFFDTADVYSEGVSEEITGRAMKHFGVRRDSVVIATKVFNPMGNDPNQRGLSRKHIMHAIDDSLLRLEMDYVDLYQIHRYDYTTPIEETLDALTDVVKAGKALYIGAS